MSVTRRQALKLIGTLASAGIGLPLDAFGSETNSAPARLPLDEFVQSPELVAALRKGVKAMKKRKPSDPLSWFYQAAMHGVTDEKILEALKDDSNITHVDVGRYWNQCPHSETQTSANFLPWHRGYTYYFERILRMHTESDNFSLPYWNYIDASNDRRFPRIYGIQYLDGDLNNSAEGNINPLFDDNRDFFFCTYQFELTDKVPLLALSSDAIDVTIPLASTVFFDSGSVLGLGGSVTAKEPATRGLLERYPHDQIHRAVGGVLGDCNGDMARPPTAGFDPVFSVHHTTIDWLWVKWATATGKSWGNLPDTSWFDERPWYFFDEQGMEINETRRFYFDHRALGIRFKYEDMSRTPLQLPSAPAVQQHRNVSPNVLSPIRLGSANVRIVALPTSQTTIQIDSTIRGVLNNFMSQRGALFRGGPQPILRFSEIEAGTYPSVGFDVHLTSTPESKLTRQDHSFLGSINLFNHRHHADMSISQDLNIGNALVSVKDFNKLSIAFIPYPLLIIYESGVAYSRSQPLSIRGVEFLTS
jgi:hypothetical protein